MSEEITRREPTADDLATIRDSSLPAGATPAVDRGVRGRYVKIAEVGRGGMGAVVRAYDPKLEREVALKIVRHELLDDTARKRVIQEARAMAKLSHPNVVAVYDVEETDDGQLMLVMELVVGKTLRRYADSAAPDAIMHALLQAGRGLAAAHDAGLLHRDFKPDNVLVGDDGRARVTDFGLAKVEGDRAETDDPRASQDVAPQDTVVELTEAGIVVGTPRYMAPEQHDGAELSPSTDQYGFCVAAWEVLSGAPPFFGEDMAQDKRQGPPGWDHSAVSLPPRVVAALRRGMAPAPAERFGSMTELLAELEPRSSTRGRWLWGGLALGLVAAAAWQVTHLSPGTACTGAREQFAAAWDEDRSAVVRGALLRMEVPFAPAVADRVVAELDRYAEDWIAMHHDACEATAIRGEQSEQVLDLRMTCLRRARDQVLAATQVLSSADSTTLEHAHELVDGLPDLDRCADLHALSAGTPAAPENIAADVEAIEADLARAKALDRAGRYFDADAVLSEIGPRAARLDYPPLAAEIALARGQLQVRLGQHDKANAELSTALVLALQHELWDTALGAALSQMNLVGSVIGEPDRAMPLAPLVEGLLERNESPFLQSRYHVVRGAIFVRAGQYPEAYPDLEEAIRLRRELFGEESVAVASSLHTLAAAQISAGRLDEAGRTQRRAYEIRTKALGPQHPLTIESFTQGGSVLMLQRRLDEALEVFEAARVALSVALGPTHLRVVTIEMDMASTLHFLGRDAEAVALSKRVVELLDAASEGDTADELDARIVYGQTLIGVGRLEAAREQLTFVLARSEEVLGPKHRRIGDVHMTLGTAYHEDPEVAREHIEAALEIFEATLGPSHRNTITARRNLAALAVNAGTLEPAEVHIREAIAAATSADVVEEGLVANLRFVLSTILVEQGEFDEALKNAELAFAVVNELDTTPRNLLDAAVNYARARWAANVRRGELVPMVRAAMARVPDTAGNAADLKQARAFVELHE